MLQGAPFTWNAKGLTESLQVNHKSPDEGKERFLKEDIKSQIIKGKRDQFDDTKIKNV